MAINLIEKLVDCNSCWLLIFTASIIRGAVELGQHSLIYINGCVCVKIVLIYITLLFLCAGSMVIRRVQSVVRWWTARRSHGCFLRSPVILKWLTRPPATSWALLTVNQTIPVLMMLSNVYVVMLANVSCLLCCLHFSCHFQMTKKFGVIFKVSKSFMCRGCVSEHPQLRTGGFLD